MTADRYRILLEHLGPTVLLTELHRSTDADLVAMRHDVDHDLGVALDLSAIERHLGERRATYFILHTHPYCEEAVFLDRLRQLVDDGHEIGLHLDAIGAWWRGETDDPLGDVERWLDRVRGAGIEIVASAAHGARSCYEGNFANHWIWSELRGDDPATTMDGISAEGVAVEDPDFRLRYPRDHRVHRPDGGTLELWTASMHGLGIEYEACTVSVDEYWSDSGGAWKRSPDPVDHDLSRGRHQVLVHPWWWREPRRDVLVLGTARTGSKWLCGRMAAGTSARVLHERTLNQDGRSIEQVAGLKRTAGDFVGLLEDVDRVKRLVDDAFVARHRDRRDTIEANVYLPHVDPELLHREGLAIVHLHRDPANVVRSILERGWYETSDDRRHPRFEVEGREGAWEAMTQVERACTYWAETNRRLLRAFPDAIRVAAEDLQSGGEAVRDLASALGFEWHEMPGRFGEDPVDQTGSWSVPAVSEWSDRDRQVFIDLCGPVAMELGRRITFERCPSDRTRVASSTSDPGGRVRRSRLGRGLTRGCRIQGVRRGLLVSASRGLVVSGDAGAGATAGLVRGFGWDGGRRSMGPTSELRGSFEAEIGGEGWVGRLFAVGVDSSGSVRSRHPLLRLDADRCGGRFSLLVDRGLAAICPVLFIDAAATPWRLEVKAMEWERRVEVGHRGFGSPD